MPLARIARAPASSESPVTQDLPVLPAVLVVEDLPDDEAMTLRALRRCGRPLSTRVAHDGVEASAMLGLSGGEPWTPDLVLCDLKMPRMSGDELLREARADARLAEVPFVVLSSSSEPADEARCLGLGASEYAVKPIGFEEYNERVGGLARRWLGEA